LPSARWTNNAYLLRCTQTGELALIDAARAGGLGGPLDGPGAEGDAGQARHQGGGAGEGDFRRKSPACEIRVNSSARRRSSHATSRPEKSATPAS
jgi:hypothetical protein